jgi:predicted nucleotidyltransferase
MTPEVAAALRAHEREVAERVLAEEVSRRRHLLVSLSGAHAYGFPSPDSDLDLKAVHVDATAELLGFPRAPRTAERLEVIDGVEIDYSSNELGPVLLGVLKGNGNYVERFLSGYLVSSGPELEALAPLVQRSLSRKLARHYQGFGRQQLAEWEKGGRASAKKLLYVLSTTLTGVHALREGEIVTDVTRLLARYGFGEALELVAQKKRGEKAELPESLREKWAARVPALFEALEQAEKESPLPEEAPNADELERWLIRTRLARLDGDRRD